MTALYTEHRCAVLRYLESQTEETVSIIFNCNSFWTVRDPTKYTIKRYNLNTVPNRSHVYGILYEGWNFNSGNYLFTTDTK